MQPTGAWGTYFNDKYFFYMKYGESAFDMTYKMNNWKTNLRKLFAALKHFTASVYFFISEDSKLVDGSPVG